MIKNIIFDFGDIFIDLDKAATLTSIISMTQNIDHKPEMLVYYDYEKGLISSEEFVDAHRLFLPDANDETIIAAWNAIIKDFPENRLQWVEKLALEGKYRLFLLSNTNELHIKKVIENMGIERYNRFHKCFEKFYLSHEIHLRKPNTDIYEFVLKQNNLTATESIFIDDTEENTTAAAKLGIHTWNLIPGKEDITNLFQHQAFTL
jgi:putative hydrolase of the HAD superfamily